MSNMNFSVLTFKWMNSFYIIIQSCCFFIEYSAISIQLHFCSCTYISCQIVICELFKYYIHNKYEFALKNLSNHRVVMRKNPFQVTLHGTNTLLQKIYFPKLFNDGWWSYYYCYVRIQLVNWQYVGWKRV